MTIKSRSAGIYPFPEPFYKNIADQIYTPIQMGENVALLLPPFFGKDHLLHYLRERKSDRERVFGKNSAKYLWQHVIVRTAEDNETQEWIQQLCYSLPEFNKKCTTLEAFFTLLRHTLEEENTHIVFVVNISEDLKLSTLERFLHLANKTLYTLPNSVHFVLTLYQKWDDASFSKAIVPFNSLFQHIIRPSHRTDDEIRHFVRYRLGVWNHQLSPSAIDIIINEAGGMPLFAKAAVRIAKREALSSANEIQGLVRAHTDYKDRIKLFWHSLSTEEQLLLKEVALDTDIQSNPQIDQFARIGLLQQSPETQRYNIRSKSLHRFLVGDAVIKVRDIAQLARLSPQELIVYSAICTPIGKIITREEVASLLWTHKEEKYSDWALDKVISRLRKKLLMVKGQAKLSLVSKKKIGVYITVL